MQLTQHISKAAWSTADKVLYLSLGLVFILPQKVIGAAPWGLFATSQAILTALFMLADGFALQIMVNFGVVEEQRKQATSAAIILYTLFIGLCSLGIWLGREEIALFTGKPDLAPVLALFPVVALSFWLRNFTLKTAQLHIDTRGTFIVDAAWAGATIALLLHGRQTGWLVDEIDMMYVTAAAAGFSSLVGLLLYAGRIRFAFRFDFPLLRRMVRFGFAQFGSAATMGFLAQGDVILLALLVSDAAVVGNYDVAKKFFRGFEGIRDAGALFVYPAVARLSAQQRKGELTVLIEKMIAFMTIILLPVVLLVWILPIEEVFGFIYKGKYDLAPDLFRILSLAALAIPFSMNSYILLGMSQVRRLFIATFSALLLFVGVSILLVPRLGAVGEAWAVVASFWMLGTISILFVAKLVGISPRRVLGRWRDVRDFGMRVLRRGK